MTNENSEIYAGLETVYRHICMTAQNSTEMLHVHPYETTVVHKLCNTDCEARLNSVNWYLHTMMMGK